MARKRRNENDKDSQPVHGFDLSGRPKTIDIQLPIETPADMADVMRKFKEWSDSVLRRDELALALKDLREHLKAASESAAAAEREALAIARAGTAVRTVELVYVADPERRVMRAFRADLDRDDPAAFVAEAAMNTGELQAIGAGDSDEGMFDDEPPDIATDDASVRGVLAAAH